jgi:hypothetical protein
MYVFLIYKENINYKMNIPRNFYDPNPFVLVFSLELIHERVLNENKILSLRLIISNSIGFGNELNLTA